MSYLPINLDGIFLKSWNNIKKVSDVLNITRSNIGECCNKKRKTSAGYKWEFKK